MKHKIKIITIVEDEIKLDDDDLMAIIKKQNRIVTISERFYMRIVN